ncbi:hypothetical protein PR048_031956 [Dryococelus australis]|uniref:Uncharacterized protein n=1 Tax=Dryococelus australis TaxID=614101 RepID=A0ABQ9G6S8_9NEOP|nr:hypothetical protein PR048_031956 [Dryococelus australis]
MDGPSSISILEVLKNKDTSTSGMIVSSLVDVVDVPSSHDWMSVGAPPTLYTASEPGLLTTFTTPVSILTRKDGAKYTSNYTLEKETHVAVLKVFPWKVTSLSKSVVETLRQRGNVQCFTGVSGVKSRGLELIMAQLHHEVSEKKKLFKFNGCSVKINDFLVKLYKVTMGDNKKKKVLKIVSEPSAFKSKFVTMIVIVIRLINLNALVCRLAIIDNPNFDDRSKETLLCLFSGGKVNVARINMSDHVQLCTHFIVLSNTQHFIGDKWSVLAGELGMRRDEMKVEKSVRYICEVFEKPENHNRPVSKKNLPTMAVGLTMDFLRPFMAFANTLSNVSREVSPSQPHETQSVSNIEEEYQKQLTHNVSIETVVTLCTLCLNETPLLPVVNVHISSVDKVIDYLHTKQAKKGYSAVKHIFMGYAKTVETLLYKYFSYFHFSHGLPVRSKEVEQLQENQGLQGTTLLTLCPLSLTLNNPSELSAV